MRHTKTASIGLAALAVGLLLLATGCRKRVVQVTPPVIVAVPETPAPPATPAAKPEVKPEPAAPTESAPAPAPEAPTSKPGAAKPTTVAKSPEATEPTNPVTPKRPPQISPRMSAEEQADHQRKTQQAIGLAERNLQRAYGRALSSGQLDLVEKIRGFLAQSREAGREGDWVRARNLAEKAQVLSIELVNSF